MIIIVRACYSNSEIVRNWTNVSSNGMIPSMCFLVCVMCTRYPILPEIACNISHDCLLLAAASTGISHAFVSMFSHCVHVCVLAIGN